VSTDYSLRQDNSEEDSPDSEEEWSVSSSQELEERVEELESGLQSLSSKASEAGCIFGGSFWGLGMTIAVVLSWSRNASILWCILHGLLSWIYVIYFAFTRQ
jgi:hypothetical protein